MKIRLVVALVGLAMSFALPTFAQQTNTPDPQLREKLVAAIKKTYRCARQERCRRRGRELHRERDFADMVRRVLGSAGYRALVCRTV